MAIKHPFASGKSDGADATLVRPSNWNADHAVDDATLTEAKLSLSDVTTKNAGTGQHGFLAKTTGRVVDDIAGDNSWGIHNPVQKGLVYATECFGTNAGQISPWFGATIGTGGAQANMVGSANHPGVLNLRSGTASGGGYMFVLFPAGSLLLLAGGEEADFIFRVDVTSGTTAYLGFHDSSNATAPVDGVWLNIAGTTLSGKAKNNAGPTTTGSTYAITQGEWYRGRIVLNSDATLATFSLFTCSDGALVWTDTVNANIPTAAGRETSHGVNLTSTATASVDTLSLDYMNIVINRTFVR